MIWQPRFCSSESQIWQKRFSSDWTVAGEVGFSAGNWWNVDDVEAGGVDIDDIGPEGGEGLWLVDGFCVEAAVFSLVEGGAKAAGEQEQLQCVYELIHRIAAEDGDAEISETFGCEEVTTQGVPAHHDLIGGAEVEVEHMWLMVHTGLISTR